MQSGDVQATSRLTQLMADVKKRGCGELRRVGAFGLVVDAWLSQSDGLALEIETLIDLSRRDEDRAMLSVGLSTRSALPSPSADPAVSAARDADLAKAVVLLDDADGIALDLITAHTAAGIAFGHRSMWELSDSQYQAALALEDRVEDEAGEAVLSAVVFNRAENQVAWASMLRQIGDNEAVVARWKSWNLLSMAYERFALPEMWKFELSALGLLLAAIAGEDRRDEISPALGPTAGKPGRGNAAEAHLRLALALSDANAGRSCAADSAETAIAVLDPSAHPHMYDLALYLAAELEAATGRRSGLRCAQRQIHQNWSGRLAKLNAMRTRIDAERMVADHERLTREATLDHLTGIGNRRDLDAYLDELRRRDTPGVALIMTDVDGFKEVNDRHGHHNGDATLVVISRLLASSIRPTDRAVRLGGDEFVVVMADADLETARKRAEAVKEQIELYPWEDMSPGLRVTVSIGVASGPLSGLELVSVCADAAVYAAKAAGGNNIVCHRPD
jgi:diguanylate cyclase (GGDEF)-like protein